LRVQQARARNAASGVAAARALQSQQLQQAQQNASQMLQAMQQAADVANQMQQMLAPCANANANSNQMRNQTRSDNTQTSQNSAASGAAKAAGKGGGMSGGAATAIAVGAAVPLGYYLYKEVYSCGAEPTISNADAIACGQGSCRACESFEQFLPYCDCMEEKHPEDQGICGMVRQAIDALYSVCRAPVPQARPATR
jgi:hypothetical protein